MSQQEVPFEELFPPSTRMILCLLAENGGAMILGQIRHKTGFARRTIFTALQKLADAGLVERRLSLRDTRQVVISLKNDEARVKARVLAKPL